MSASADQLTPQLIVWPIRIPADSDHSVVLTPRGGSSVSDAKVDLGNTSGADRRHTDLFVHTVNHYIGLA